MKHENQLLTQTTVDLHLPAVVLFNLHELFVSSEAEMTQMEQKIWPLFFYWIRSSSCSSRLSRIHSDVSQNSSRKTSSHTNLHTSEKSEQRKAVTASSIRSLSQKTITWQSPVSGDDITRRGPIRPDLTWKVYPTFLWCFQVQKKMLKPALCWSGALPLIRPVLRCEWPWMNSITHLFEL